MTHGRERHITPASLLVYDTRPEMDRLRAQAAHCALRSIRNFADDNTLTPARRRAITDRLQARPGEVETQLADAGRLDAMGPLVGAETSVRRGRASAAAAVLDVLITVTLHPPRIGPRTVDPDSVEITWRVP